MYLFSFILFIFLQEAGIPIDMVGGVSIGAFMGGLWCQERNVTTLTQKAREWSKVKLLVCGAQLTLTSLYFLENDTVVASNFGSYLSHDLNV